MVQTDLKFMGSNDAPASVSSIVRNTGMYQHIHLQRDFFNLTHFQPQNILDLKVGLSMPLLENTHQQHTKGRMRPFNKNVYTGKITFKKYTNSLMAVSP